MGTDHKRRLPVEFPGDRRVTKRLRSPNTGESSQLQSDATKREKASLHGSSVLAGLARKSDRDGVVETGHGDTDTSSSSSDLEDTSEEISSVDKDETSSTRVGGTDKGDSCEDDDLIQDLPVPRKPLMSVSHATSDLRTRLSAFLPQLQKANADLENATEACLRPLDEVADDEDHYIEMNLGLGVLKEKRPPSAQVDGLRLADEDGTSSSEDSGSDPTEARGNVVDQSVESAAITNFIGAKRSGRERPSIQDLTDGCNADG
ncbi:hypothetical protein EPUS_00555 [Endocarpon pusillum Z07020]|uniref:Uncharacterized protein n=1 Tax=Endocarpon pusillum (strain Z07020 / HMAS-L-300199) TaxID=1263415 RepID=U1GID4_ENDPU|nr:uncharacterized protein EPUS_00555 [Endocarpon pusillum Z07020]ERF71566.1 hypothetical protein EPUS_00555 [Endocarpon pusillum Z07020]